MPKTILEFSAEEEHELEMCQNGMRYHSIIWEFKEYLRCEMKHGDLSDDRYHTYEIIQSKLFDLIDEYKAHLE